MLRISSPNRSSLRMLIGALALACIEFSSSAGLTASHSSASFRRFPPSVKVKPLQQLPDSTTAKWIGAASLNTARNMHTATLLPNGKVLAFGGLGDVNTGMPALVSAELFDSAVGAWTSAGNLLTARHQHTATL